MAQKVARKMVKKTESAILRRLRERKGRRAENAAALWLQMKGYRILDRRARTPACEIDLIATKKNLLVFVEVKMRARHETALEAVTPGLRRRIEQAARTWTTRRHKLQNHIWRFDIVLMSPGRFPRHMSDAWRAEK